MKYPIKFTAFFVNTFSPDLWKSYLFNGKIARFLSKDYCYTRTHTRSESQPIIAEGNLNAFNALVIEAEAGGVDVLVNTKLVYDFVLGSIIENLAGITNSFTGQPMPMLCSRGIYTTDKKKKDAMEKKLMLRHML